MAQTNEHEESHKTTTVNKYETHVARLHSISPQLRGTTVSISLSFRDPPTPSFLLKDFIIHHFR